MIRLSDRSTAAEARADAADAATLRAALARHHGAVARAAAELGVSTDTLHRRIARYSLRAWLDATYPRAARQPRRSRAEKST